MKVTDLVIDVGFHLGEDTRFYLDKGFRCVGVEANPELVERAQSEFAAEIADGRLRIFGVAISEHPGMVQLSVADEALGWSTLSPIYAGRMQTLAGMQCRTIEVPSMRFEDILEEVGIPHYLKVDIEGLDMLCVRALRKFDERPDFISIESAVSEPNAPLDKAFDELAELWTLGYRRFAYVNQMGSEFRRGPQPPREGRYVDAPIGFGLSGYFGEELPKRWLSMRSATVRAQLLRIHFKICGYGGAWSSNPLAFPYLVLMKLAWKVRHPAARLSARPWWDLHARLG